MRNDRDQEGGESTGLKRRRILSMGAGATAAAAGLGALSGTVGAWEGGLGADFRGCREVWLLVTENDLEFRDANGERYDGLNDEPPLVVYVVVADGDDAVCRTVEITHENATTIPGQYGDTPIVKYAVSGGEKILGVIGASPSRNPLDCEVIENDHRCTQSWKPKAPKFEEADCYADRYSC